MTGDRHDSTCGTWRLARGAVVGVSAGALGLSAHVAGGASAPAPSLWLLLTGIAVAVSVLASRWRWTMPSLLLVFLGAQLGFHAAFEAYGAHAGHSEHAGHLASTAPEPRMVVTHVIAAVVLATLMRFGESGLRSALDVLVMRAVRLVHTEMFALPEVDHRVRVVDDFVTVSHDPARVWGSRAPPR